MAKLYFRYSAMNAGKSTMAIQVAYNYQEVGKKALVWKPKVDTKGEDTITSRIGIYRKVDKLIASDESIIKIFTEAQKNIGDISAIIVDEAQFLEEEQVDELYYIAKIYNIPVLCYGLRCDFQMKLFPGSKRLLAIADDFDEIKNMCAVCGKSKATQNLRLINNVPTFEGSQVEIDGTKNVTYKAVCGKCYLELRENYKEENTLARKRKIQ